MHVLTNEVLREIGRRMPKVVVQSNSLQALLHAVSRCPLVTLLPDSVPRQTLPANLMVRQLPLPGMPHLGSGITWDRNGHKVLATPHLNEGVLSVIDMTDWSLVKQIRTDGPGFFLRSHETSPYVWADVFFGPHKDEMHIIDKQSLEIVRTLNPAPGKTVAHTEFTRDGSHALVSIWEDDGAVIVYDARTLEEVRRLPMKKPSGKYNVWNKIHFEEGTSH